MHATFIHTPIHTIHTPLTFSGRHAETRQTRGCRPGNTTCRLGKSKRSVNSVDGNVNKRHVPGGDAPLFYPYLNFSYEALATQVN